MKNSISASQNAIGFFYSRIKHEKFKQISKPRTYYIKAFIALYSYINTAYIIYISASIMLYGCMQNKITSNEILNECLLDRVL